MSAAAAMAFVALTTPGVAADEDSFVPVPTIAFSSSRDNTAINPILGLEIYLTDMDATNPRRLTANSDTDSFPALSPDGKKISFDSNRLRVPGEGIILTDLWVMDVDGTDQSVLFNRAGSSSWSPDSKNLVFHASASGTGVPIHGGIGAATNDSDIFVLNVDDCLPEVCGAVNITNSADMIDDDPDWSPDGQRIVHTSHSVDDRPPPIDFETAEIFTMNSDGTDRQQLTLNNEEERAPAWSPDGTKICYMCRALALGSGIDFEICVMNADGSNQVALTNNTVPDLTPNWTPDGTHIIFHREINGLNQLHIMDADGTNIRQITFPPGHNLFANPGYVRVHIKD